MNTYKNRKNFQHLKVLIFILVMMILIMKYIGINTHVAEPDLNSERIENDDINKNCNDNENVSFTVITGASENHFCPLKAFLYNMSESIEGSNYNMVVYDLGLSNEQRTEIENLKNLSYLSELRTFNYSKYPSFWNISDEKGEYAWKPGIVKEISKDYPGTLVWVDTGTKVERFLFTELKQISKKFGGFASPSSPGLMEDWTHPGVYDYYKDDHSKYDKLVNCNAAFVIFDTYKVQYLIDQWYDCALVKDCIAPDGSSRDNHRQDQAILTYLAAKDNRYCNQDSRLFGVTTHEDNLCNNTISDYELNYPELLFNQSSIN